MTEHITESDDAQSSINQRGLDLEGRIEELRRDLQSLLSKGRGAVILERFCATHQIQTNGDLENDVLTHFRSLPSKPRTLNKFRSKITRLIHNAVQES